jgi:DNA-binding MarR family transcriptional regulator
MAARKPPARRAAAGAASGRQNLDQGALLDLAGYNIRRAEMHMSQAFQRALATKKLRAPEFSTLLLVANNSQPTQADIAKALSIHRPNMVGIIERLEQRGLLQRTVYEHDRRNHVLALTAKGATLLAAAQRLVHKLERDVTRCWSEEERAQAIELLRRLHTQGRPQGRTQSQARPKK